MFKDQVVWITGASSGIGEAIAKHIAELGAELILSGRREDALEKVARLCSGAKNTHIIAFDIADESAIAPAVAQAISQVGRVDVLINNAGISQRSSMLETQISTYRKLFDVNVFGQIALTKAVTPHMLEQGGGHIAITASVAGKIGVPFRTGYSATKHAVMGFYDALRTEVAQHNIQVTTITPGYIRTNISKNALRGDGQEFGKTDDNIAGGMDADQAAQVIVTGMQKGKREIPVGKGLEMHMLRVKRFFPNLLLTIMNKQYQRMAKANQTNKS